MLLTPTLCSAWGSLRALLATHPPMPTCEAMHRGACARLPSARRLLCGVQLLRREVQLQRVMMRALLLRQRRVMVQALLLRRQRRVMAQALLLRHGVGVAGVARLPPPPSESVLQRPLLLLLLLLGTLLRARPRKAASLPVLALAVAVGLPLQHWLTQEREQRSRVGAGDDVR